MFLIQNILIDERIIKDQFVCDTNKCKGACCTLKGGGGAPLLKEEIVKIESVLSESLQYLDDKSKKVLEEQGFVFQNDDRSLEIRCVDETDCVFVFYENSIAKCALEKAFYEKNTEFKKPISCHLFPLRVRNFGGDFLSYEPFEECLPASENGKHLRISVWKFLEEPLTRLYGAEWYKKLSDYACTVDIVSGEVQ